MVAVVLSGTNNCITLFLQASWDSDVQDDDKVTIFD